MQSFQISTLTNVSRGGSAKGFFKFSCGNNWQDAQALLDKVLAGETVTVTLREPDGELPFENRALKRKVTHLEQAQWLFASVVPCDTPEDAPKPRPRAERPVVNTPRQPINPSEGGLGDKVADALGLTAVIQAAVDAAIPNAVADAVAKATEGRVTVTHEVRHADKTIVIDGLVHQAFGEIIEAINAGFVNIFLRGPAGTGKSTLGKQVAKALDVAFASLSCSGGMTESALTGRLLPGGEGGRFKYYSSDFVECYTKPSVILLDEFDAIDPNVAVVANSATANGGMHIDTRRVGGEFDSYIERDPRCIIIVAANTYGLGADAQYVGRNPLDAATLDRYVGAMIEVDYDPEIERALGDPEIVALVQVWRHKAQAAKLQRVISTRMIESGTKWKRAGKPLKTIKAKLLFGWKPDELNWIGESL